ncbi:MAG: flavodoxin family protein [Vicinamibacterales bacterium]
MREPTHVLIAYDSRRGSVEQLAHAVAAGARDVENVEVVVKRVGDVTREDLLGCDGLAVGSPVHSGMVSVPVKQFFDDWQFRFDFYPDRPMDGRVGAVFVAGGQAAAGREPAMTMMLLAMLHHRMLVVSGGGAVGASAVTETKSEPVDSSELQEARALGRRLAETARLVAAGRRVSAVP